MNRRHVSLVVVLLLVGLLVGLRLALPSILEREINSIMAEMGEYSGNVDGVGVALWRGAYTLHDLRIEKRNGEIPVPLLAVPRVNISLSWRDLVRGAIVADVAFEQPTVNFVDGRDAEDTQSGAGVDWRRQLEDLVPIRIDEILVHGGTVTFHNFISEPPVDLSATSVEASILNLTNVRDAQGRRVAEMEATATLFDSANLEASARFDPFGRVDTFSFAVRVLGIDLTQLNELAQAYARLDFESGNGELVVELEADEGQISGYAMPLFQNLQIFSWESDVEEADKHPLQLAWEAVVEGVTTLFRNPPADQFGTRFEIEGDISNPEVSVLSALGGILRNAFGEAFRPYFEGTYLRPRESN